MPRTVPFDAAPSTLPILQLRCALIIGALVDLLGAIKFAFFPAGTLAEMQLPPGGAFWPRYAAVFLVVLAILYCVTAINPARSLANIGVAIVGRTLGMAFYMVFALVTPGTQRLVVVLSVANLVFAGWYFIALGPSGRQQLYAALRPPESTS